MAYITREDGERFVIPSYRDVLTTKQKSQLKKEIILFSLNYGEYITLQRKGPSLYEVAFSPDTGYLLGETVWYHFKRPSDMIYCELIPNSSEAILVIVKNGSVYLDGAFPVESIPEELIVFLTQQNNFEIYTYGDVPIAETPQEGKFAFDSKSVKSFTVLPEPVFQKLPLLKIYRLQLVEPVLKSQGIGVFPLRQLLIVVAVIGLTWMGWTYLHSQKQNVTEIVSFSNPYQGYLDELASPAPDQEITTFLKTYATLFSISGWQPTKLKYSGGDLTVTMVSAGNQIQQLMEWASKHNAQVQILQDGIYLKFILQNTKREQPTQIYTMNDVIANVIDKIGMVYPGNHFSLTGLASKGSYSVINMKIDVKNATDVLLSLIGAQLKGLPLALKDITLDIHNGSMNGSITLDALGS